ncbi:MAG: shikimate kinase [Planctomycetota bacterium]
MSDAPNIVLIGMPAVGKSTVGVLLAKATSRAFIDTDVVLQARAGRRLQAIIEAEGLGGFRAMEERAVLALDCRSHVIATGGSVVYSPRAMRHLKASGFVVHLHLPLPVLERRLTDLGSRGVVMAPGESLRELFAERQPLYERWADTTIDCADLGHEAVVAAILERLDAWLEQAPD